MIPEDSAARHDRIGEIFGEVLDLPPAERPAFLERACGADAAMIAEIEALLAADSQSFRFFGSTASRNAGPGSFPATGGCVKQCRQCGLCLETAGLSDGPAECPEDGAPLEPAFPGEALIDGKYRVLRRLGQGGMGAVYRARHSGLGRDFALKLIAFQRNDPASVEMFSAEAKALGQLKHPHIVDVTDYGIDPRGLPYLVMELLEGATLERPLPLERAIEALSDVAAALEAVHARGLLHRDLKPSNALLTAAGVKLIDFGLVAARERGAGTPAFLAPELKEGAAATRASDLYAFGMMARKMIADPPPELARAIESLLDPDPRRRPATAALASEALRSAWLAARQRQWRSREIPRRARWAAVCGPVLALLAVACGRLPFLDSLEARAADSRTALVRPIPPDPRILLVSIDEASVSAVSAPLAARGAEFGRMLERILDAGAARIGVDLLLPESWSREPEFSRFVLRASGRLTLSLLSGPGSSTTGSECVNGLTAAALGPEKLDALFAFVNLEQDSDGAIRHARSWYRDGNGKQRASWPAALAGSGGAPAEFRLAPVDRARFDKIPWKDVSAILDSRPDRFRGRLVLLGAEYAGSGDVHRLGGEAEVSGLEVQAAALATILAGYPARETDLIAVLLAALFPALVLLGRSWMLPAACAAYVAAAWFALPAMGVVTPVVWPVLAAIAAAVLARFAGRRWPRFPIADISAHDR